MIVPSDNLEVLISPTTRCNLRCRYCYVDKSSNCDVSDLSLQDADIAFSWLEEYAQLLPARRIRITWFGGEPMLRGPEFLAEALEIQSKWLKTFDVVCNMQTNLTTDPEPFVPIIKQYFHGHLGFSVDFQGNFRVTSNGDHIQEVVEHNIHVLQANGIDLGAVCTVTKQDIGKGADIYSYFKQLGVMFRVNRAASSPQMAAHGLILSTAEYERIVMDIMDCYLSDPAPSISFLNFDLMVNAYSTGSAILCVDSTCPERYIGLEAAGRIMPRCRFLPQVGNYLTDAPKAIRDRLLSCATAWSRPGQCSSCEFWGKVCLGGCPGEPMCDCVISNCGYRTETTCGIWRYVRNILESQGLSYRFAATRGQ